jgi:hypothetical protein
VHYDPDNLSAALLEPGVPDNEVFTFLLYVVGVAGGAVLLSVGLLCAWDVASWERWAHIIE